jgi:hypothetical protein
VVATGDATPAAPALPPNAAPAGAKSDTLSATRPTHTRMLEEKMGIITNAVCLAVGFCAGVIYR